MRGGAGWDEMSGPGPWMFVDAQVSRRLHSRSRRSRALPPRRRIQPANIIRSLNSFDGGAQGLGRHLVEQGASCNRSVRPRASVNVATALFVAVANNPRPEGDGRLAMQKYEVTASTFLDRWKIFEAYAGGGVLQGLGKSEFTRGYWTVTGTISPVRRPGTGFRQAVPAQDHLGERRRGRRAERVHGQRLRGAERPFRTEGEILKTISITLDFSRY